MIEERIQATINNCIRDLADGTREAAKDLQKLANVLGNDLQPIDQDVEAVEGRPVEPPTLPQDSRNPEARQKQLEAARELYRYEQPAFLPPLVNTAGVPVGEELTKAYQSELLPVILDIAVNEVRAASHYFQDHPDKHPDFSQLPAYLEQAAGRLGPTTLLKNMMDYLLDGVVARLDHPDDFKSMWQTINAPALVASCDEDSMFAWQRIAGANTTLIQRIDAVPDNFPVSDAMLAGSVAGETSLEAAAKEGRLFLCDYRILDGIPGGSVFGLQKHLCAPMALFCWTRGGRDGGRLHPVAIQLAQKPDPESAPIFTPQDGIKWRIAKLFVQNADGIQLQSIAHLQHCHLNVEPIILPTMRQLAGNHPVHVLLKPHFRFTIAINENSRTSLVTPQGVVDSILSPDLEQGTYELIRRAHGEWRFDEATPDVMFKARGVDDPDLLTFPFRDDTLLLWRSIQNHVDGYLQLYYPTDKTLAEDVEIQAWIAEIRSADGSSMKGLDRYVDANGRITRVSDLSAILAYVIYIAGPQHASANYGMYDFEGFLPACPLSLWAPPPTASSVENDATFVARLPPVDIALYQAQFSYLLAKQRFDCFGRFPADTFTDPRVLALNSRLVTVLTQVEATIEDRNRGRLMPYVMQLPSRVPNSISI